VADSRSAGPLRERVDALVARLGAAGAAAERDALKADIAALYRAIDQEAAALAALRDEVRSLAQQWKELAPGEAMRTPVPAGVTITPPSTPATKRAEGQPAPERPMARADHLGASTYIEKGWSRISLGDAVGAEAALTRALELAPDDPQAESLLGWAQMLQEKYDEALLNFQRVLMREPSNALARMNVGYICLKKRIFGEAIEHLSRAIRLDNDRKATLYAHHYLGLVYLEREMYDDAQGFFRQAIAMGPNMIEAYYELGRALWFGGDREAARQAWRDGFGANKFNPWGKRCAELLETVDAGGAPPLVAS
jgi:tetratricopeptide (TPR) repeat protein